MKAEKSRNAFKKLFIAHLRKSFGVSAVMENHAIFALKIADYQVPLFRFPCHTH